MNKINFNENNNYTRFKSVPQEQSQVVQSTSVAQNIQETQLPALYELNINNNKPQSFKEKIKKADPMGMISPVIEMPVAGALTALALIKGVDAYSNACGGEYEKSILGKATRFGDRIAQSDFWKKETPKKCLNATLEFWEKLKGWFNKSDLLRAMKETPAIPEKEMAKYELKAQSARFLEDFNKITGTYFQEEEAESIITIIKDAFRKTFNPNRGWVDIKELGLDSAEKEALKKKFNVSSLSKISQDEIANWTILKRLEIPEAEIDTIIKSSDAIDKVKDKMLKAMNLSLEEIEAIRKNPELPANISKVKEVTSKIRNKIKIGAGNYKLLGPFQFLERTISMDQVANKLHSIEVGPTGGAKTKLGAFCAKVLHKIHRGFTFGGGKLGMMLFILPGMVLAMKNTKKAEKDEKVGTLAKGFIESISWVFTFPLSIATTYALGGMKNAGVSADNVKECSRLIKEFNEKTFANENLYKTELGQLKNKLKKLRTVKDQNLLTKIGKGISSFLYQDLEQIKPFQNGNRGGDFLRSLKKRAKNLTFEPIRFILFMFVIEAFFHKVIEKGIRAVFGKSYNEEKEAEYESKLEEQKKFLKQDLRARLLSTQQEKNTGIALDQTSNFAPPESLQAILANEKLKNKREELYKEQYQLMQNNKNVREHFAEIQSKKPNATQEANNTQRKTTASTISAKGKAPQNYQINLKSTNKKADTHNYIPSEKQKIKPETKEKTANVDNYTYIPSSKNLIKNDLKENNTQKYIPAQTSKVSAKKFDNSKVDAALKRADKAEQKAFEILAGNF